MALIFASIGEGCFAEGEKRENRGGSGITRWKRGFRSRTKMNQRTARMGEIPYLERRGTGHTSKASKVRYRSHPENASSRDESCGTNMLGARLAILPFCIIFEVISAARKLPVESCKLVRESSPPLVDPTGGTPWRMVVEQDEG